MVILYIKCDYIFLEMREVFNVSREIRRMRWNWISYILRKDLVDDCVVVLWQMFEGRRMSECLKIMW